ncbi:unnamed protein product [Mytilus coruscus]|uniref:G-protein coupled receptors family 1 profile domain-containing protein n=1 Tax=Mytilus coruscus TaxID=42192 RepID=A0A6J8DZA4_MYTCO|nr:unnamed protein product [Mytilus coruscus]
MKTIKDGQYFIPYLDVADLPGNVICSLFGLSMTLMPLTYEFGVLCTSGWLLGSTTTFMSIQHIQRYLKVCRRKARKTYEYLMKGDQSEVELQTCIKNKHYEKQTKEQSISTRDSDLKTDNSTNLPSNEQLSNKIILDMGGNSLRNNCKVIKKQSKKLRNRRVISKITKTFMIITLIFLICSLPKIMITILETVTTDFWEKASDIERLVLMFVHQGYILNNIANPFIDAFFDETFKTEIKSMFFQSICTRKVKLGVNKNIKRIRTCYLPFNCRYNKKVVNISYVSATYLRCKWEVRNK